MSAAAAIGAGLSPPELAQVANGEHELARAGAESFVYHADRCGQALIEAKEKVGHGEWLPWLAANFNGSERTAQAYTRLAANPQRVADLEEPSLRKALQAIAGKTTTELMHSSESNEWYTPAGYVEIVRDFLGSIDLDPASSPQANEVVQAGTFWTREDDGLARPWFGRVFCNPPYGDECPAFVEKALQREQDEAVLLVNAYSTETRWFQPLFDWPICFVTPRIPFKRPDGSGGSPAFASAFAYIGPRRSDFARHFSRIGAVVERATVEAEPSEALFEMPAKMKKPDWV
ncbi:MAG: DUF3102 domain-containing protein [Actinobacteria bacterium]|nr:DUF3102 domain-containing protein [Actinomycetota bacterium]